MIRKMIGHSNNHLAWINIKIKIKRTSQYIQIFGMYLFTMITETWRSLSTEHLYSMGRILQTQRFTTWDLSPSMYLFIDGY